MYHTIFLFITFASHIPKRIKTFLFAILNARPVAWNRANEHCPNPGRARSVTRPRPVALRTAQAVPSAPKVSVRLLCVFFIIFDFPGFTMQLAMDATGRWVGSPILQVITISSELFVIGVILGSKMVAGAKRPRQPARFSDERRSARLWEPEFEGLTGSSPARAGPPVRQLARCKPCRLFWRRQGLARDVLESGSLLQSSRL